MGAIVLLQSGNLIHIRFSFDQVLLCININNNKQLERLHNESGNVLVARNIFTCWLEDVEGKGEGEVEDYSSTYLWRQEAR